MRLLLTCVTVFLAALDATAARRSFVLATTTSVENSGLLRVIAAAFEKESGIEIHAVAVGSGKALRMAEHGDAQALLTHDPDAERRFVRAGHARIYRPFMWNDFIIVGPAGDPAGVRRSKSAAEAFRRIHAAGAPFASRSDQSGTAARETRLWRSAGVDPSKNRRYRPLGQGMAALLRSASELHAYALTDRATWEQLAARLELRILYERDPELRNVYAVTLVRSPTAPRAAGQHASAFVAWLLSPRGRSIVETFRIHGRQQFFWIEAPQPPPS